MLSMAHANDGLIYIATQSGGINTFDGHNFKNFHSDKFSSLTVWKIISASDGSLWIASESGLFQAKNNKIKQYTEQDGFTTSPVWCIFEDRLNNVWIGTEEHGLYMFNGKNFTHYGINDGLGFSKVNAIGEDAVGNIWVGSYGYGVARIKNHKAKNVTGISHFDAKLVNAFLLDEKNRFFCASDNGLWQLEDDIFKRPEFVDSSLHTMSLIDVEEGPNNSIWVATEEDGIHIYSKGKSHFITDENGLNTNYIYDLYKDNNNNLWVGTDGTGISLFQGFAFTSYNKKIGLSSNQIMCLEEDRFGNVWFGSEKGLDRMAPDGSIKSFSSENGLPHDYVTSVIEDHSGDVWVSTIKGVALIKSHGDSVLYPKQFDDTEVYSVYEANPGEMWLSTDDGVQVLTKDSIYHLLPSILGETTVNYIYEDLDGLVWFLTESKVISYDGSKSHEYSFSVETGSFRDITQDNHGNHFVLHQLGVSVIREDGSSILLNETNGLSNNSPYFVRFVDGFLWVGHQSGLDRIVLSSNGMINTKRSFSSADGFGGVETNDKAFIVGSDGSVWFGSIKGAYRYVQENDIPKTTAPFMLLKGLRIQYGAVNWRTAYPDYKEKNGLPVNPVFDHEHNHISFDFTGIDFQNADGVVYQFMLEGYDNDWSPETKETSASYPYLPPGSYTFKVRCRDAYGNWSDEKEYHFEIEGPFWTKTWFYAIIIPLSIIIIYFLLLWRTRRLSRSKRRLEELIRQRTFELQKNNKDLERLSIVAREIYDAVLICDAYGNIEWYNKSFHEMAGYETLEEFQASKYGKIKNLKDLSSYDELPAVIAGFHEVDKAFRYDSLHLSKTGNKRWTGGTLTPIYNKKGKLQNIIGVYTDITDRKTFESELRKKNKELEKLSMVAQRMNEAVIITDEFGVIQYYNFGMVRNSGYTKEEFGKIIEKAHSIQNLSSNKNIEEIVQNFHISSETIFYDSFHNKKNGEIMWTTASLTPVYQDGILRNIVVVYTDITDRKQIANRLIQTNKDLTDSIVYAKQIQRAVLPDIGIMQSYFKSSFVLYKPRDIVSGDFYWFSHIRGVLVFAAADCTGHGVPGAFMSMIGNEFLHQIVNNSNIDAPHQALERLDKMIIRALHQSEEGVASTKDGMDIALCAVHLDSMMCQFAGAFNPLYVVRNGELMIFEPTKESIGGSYDHDKNFSSHEFQLEHGDCLYVFSDGFTDQFGGPKNKKFTRKRFKQLLLEVNHLSMEDQHTRLNDAFKSWQGDQKQVDDVLVIGVRID